MEVSLLFDEYTLPTLRVGLKILNLSEKEVPLICFPMEHSDQENTSVLSLRFVEELFNSSLGQGLSHLIYIERVGPNHTFESLLAQKRNGSPPIKTFKSMLLPSIRNRCFNARLEDVTRFTSQTHLLIEFQKQQNLPLETIGIGDRGNEIGAGKIPWEVFQQTSMTHREPVFCCRMETDDFISSGISNWGGLCVNGRNGTGEKETRYSPKSYL